MPVVGNEKSAPSLPPVADWLPAILDHAKATAYAKDREGRHVYVNRRCVQKRDRLRDVARLERDRGPRRAVREPPRGRGEATPALFLRAEPREEQIFGGCDDRAREQHAGDRHRDEANDEPEPSRCVGRAHERHPVAHRKREERSEDPRQQAKPPQARFRSLQRVHRPRA